MNNARTQEDATDCNFCIGTIYRDPSDGISSHIAYDNWRVIPENFYRSFLNRLKDRSWNLDKLVAMRDIVSLSKSPQHNDCIYGVRIVIEQTERLVASFLRSAQILYPCRLGQFGNMHSRF